jgi:nucleolar protein 12
VESTRFRSIAFKNPTTQLEQDDGKKSSTGPTKLARQQERAANWRSEQTKGDGEEAADAPTKVYQKPSEKKKVAFIKKEFHQEADTCNAYIVFAHPSPDRAPNVPPTLDPFQAANLICEKANGTTFMDRTLRVDRLGKDATASSSSDGDAIALRDPKRTVFVGNLDFAAKEEDLRVFFEGLISTDRGPCTIADEDSEQEDEEATVAASWVRSVRIVRDKDTQVGKGFGYVLFAVSTSTRPIERRPHWKQDRQCVDEVVAMDEAKIKFAKRKLRVSRCKTAGSASAPKPKRSGTHAQTAVGPKSKRPQPAITVKGDPGLGDRIKHLSKDARKHAKASDTTRTQRRLEKKKLRMQLERGIKKERSRVRKPVTDGKPAPAKKGRVRSEKSLGKRNAKK